MYKNTSRVLVYSAIRHVGHAAAHSERAHTRKPPKVNTTNHQTCGARVALQLGRIVGCVRVCASLSALRLFVMFDLC